MSRRPRRAIRARQAGCEASAGAPRLRPLPPQKFCHGGSDGMLLQWEGPDTLGAGNPALTSAFVSLG